MGLGVFPKVGVADARQQANDARELISQGINPIIHRRTAQARAEKQAEDQQALALRQAEEAKKAPSERKLKRSEVTDGVTFSQVEAEYTATHEPTWKGEAHRQRWRRNFDAHAKALKDVAVADISEDMVLAILTPLWLTKHETASKLRNQIERVLDYADFKGLRTGRNPAAWRGRLEHALPKRPKSARVKHHPSLPWPEMPEFMAILKAHTKTQARMIEFGIYCASRPGEVRMAEWSEISDDFSLWTIPGEKMKMDLPHPVPLSRQAQELLKNISTTSSPFIFTHPHISTKIPIPYSDATCDQFLNQINYGKITQHGFRSSFRDWVGDTRPADRILAEEALAHAVGSKTERAYRRSDALDLRGKLMQDWADYCTAGM